MNKFNLIFFSLVTLMMTACSQTPKEKTLEEELAEIRANQVDFSKDATPKDFSAKTTDGNTFNSKDNKGKFWVLFVYDKSYLAKSESYDMVAELNNTYKLYGAKIPMVGMANGLDEDETQLKRQFADAKFAFKQIDNTKSPTKDAKVKDNVFCTPAKIIIDPNGKVVYNGCGGKTEKFDLMLADLIKQEKL